MPQGPPLGGGWGQAPVWLGTTHLRVGCQQVYSVSLVHVAMQNFTPAPPWASAQSEGSLWTTPSTLEARPAPRARRARRGVSGLAVLAEGESTPSLPVFGACRWRVGCRPGTHCDFDLHRGFPPSALQVETCRYVCKTSQNWARQGLQSLLARLARGDQPQMVQQVGSRSLAAPKLCPPAPSGEGVAHPPLRPE